MLITHDEFRDGLYGFNITDCAVRNRNFLHFSVRHGKESEDAGILTEHTVTKKEVGVYLNRKLESRLSTLPLRNFERLLVGATMDDRWNQVVCVDLDGQVYARGNGEDKVEKRIPKSMEGPMRSAVVGIKTIQGRLYAVGGSNSVCYRVGPDQWQSLCLNLPMVKSEKEYTVDWASKNTFRDIDGFSFDDLYVAGGEGHVFHFDGKQWQQIAFPSNMYLHAVCCGGDGYVYIGAQSGALFKGRGDTWKKIDNGGFSLPYKDMVWFKNQLWCTSDYGLWVLDEKGKIIDAPIPDEIKICSGNLSVGDDVMLMAGLGGAAYHDGQQWHLIFNALKMSEQVEKQSKHE